MSALKDRKYTVFVYFKSSYKTSQRAFTAKTDTDAVKMISPEREALGKNVYRVLLSRQIGSAYPQYIYDSDKK